MATQELNWSTFLREPTRVDSLLEKGDVVLKRRDGEALRLSRASQRGEERQAIATAMRLLGRRFSTGDLEPPLAEVGDRLPWTRFLPEADRAEFAREFLSQLEACADLGDFTALGRLLTEWKNTAAAFADGVGGELARPVDEVGDRVERPRR